MNENDDPGRMIRIQRVRVCTHKANKRRHDEQAIKSEENNPSSDTAIKKKNWQRIRFLRALVGVSSVSCPTVIG